MAVIINPVTIYIVFSRIMPVYGKASARRVAILQQVLITLAVDRHTPAFLVQYQMVRGYKKMPAPRCGFCQWNNH
jgi:hypothetical protein